LQSLTKNKKSGYVEYIDEDVNNNDSKENRYLINHCNAQKLQKLDEIRTVEEKHYDLTPY